MRETDTIQIVKADGATLALSPDTEWAVLDSFLPVGDRRKIIAAARNKVTTQRLNALLQRYTDNRDQKDLQLVIERSYRQKNERLNKSILAITLYAYIETLAHNNVFDESMIQETVKDNL